MHVDPRLQKNLTAMRKKQQKIIELGLKEKPHEIKCCQCGVFADKKTMSMASCAIKRKGKPGVFKRYYCPKCAKNYKPRKGIKK